MDICFDIQNDSQIWSNYLEFSIVCDLLWNKLQKKMRIGVACSGGPDSLLAFYFLLLYKKLNPEKIDFLILLHVVDGQEKVDMYLESSVQKARSIVTKIASKEFVLIDIIENSDISVFIPNASFESICHTIRKEIFIQKREEYNLDRIITGHNKTDQIEHFLIGIIRQSSMKRISGMNFDSGKYLRPLLFLTKEEIVQIIKKLKIEYLDDMCNTLDISLRNKIRKNIIPILNNLDKRSENSIVSFMGELTQYEEYINQEIKKIMAEDCYHIMSYFQSLHEILQKKIIEKELYKKGCAAFSSKKIINEIWRFFVSSTAKNNHSVGQSIVLSKKNGKWQIFHK